MRQSKNKEARRWARKGKTDRKRRRRITTGSYTGQRKEFNKKVEVTLIHIDGDKPRGLCDKTEHEMRLTHITTHRWNDGTVRSKAHYIEVLEVEDDEGNTSKVDGSLKMRTYRVQTHYTVDKHKEE